MGLTRGGLNTFLGLDRELIGEGGLSERGLKGECTLLKYQRANIGLSSLCYNTVIVILQGPSEEAIWPPTTMVHIVCIHCTRLFTV